MRSIKRILVCAGLILAILVTMNGIFSVNAASNIITVTSAITDERLYSGNDLQEAFDAAQRGCIVSIGRTYRLTEDVVLEAEIMISGQNFLKFGDYHIQLNGNGAIYVTERFSRSTYITALNEYSEVDWLEESGGYIYYLVPEAPTLENYVPEVAVGGAILGARVMEEEEMILLDTVAEGVSTADLAAAVSVNKASAGNTEFLNVSFEGDVSGMVVNGTIMTITAFNNDSSSTVSEVYTVVILGDVNANGRIDAADASMIACYAAGTQELSSIAQEAANANADDNGDITAADAQMLSVKYVTSSEYVSPLSE